MFLPPERRRAITGSMHSAAKSRCGRRAGRRAVARAKLACGATRSRGSMPESSSPGHPALVPSSGRSHQHGISERSWTNGHGPDAEPLPDLKPAALLPRSPVSWGCWRRASSLPQSKTLEYARISGLRSADQHHPRRREDAAGQDIHPTDEMQRFGVSAAEVLNAQQTETSRG